jgi:hypothetical protein
MSISDKIKDKSGMALIKISIKGLSKQKLLGIISLCSNAKQEDFSNANEIIESVKKEWFKRHYDLQELEQFIKLSKGE